MIEMRPLLGGDAGQIFGGELQYPSDSLPEEYGPPRDGLFRPKRRVKSQWVDVVTIPAGEAFRNKAALKELADRVRMVSFGFFANSLQSCVLELKRRMNGREEDAVVLVQPGKSNQWVAELAYNYGFHAGYYALLGEKDAASLVETVERGDPSIREMISGKHFVLFDDATYSGNQMSNHIAAIKSANIPFHQLTVVVPFVTSAARSKILGSFGEAFRFELESMRGSGVSSRSELDRYRLITDCEMPTIEKLSRVTREAIPTMWPVYSGRSTQRAGHRAQAYSVDGVGLWCFAHKTPNAESFFAGFTGLGKERRGKLITIVDPPYKAVRAKLPTIRAVRDGFLVTVPLASKAVSSEPQEDPLEIPN